MAGEYINADPLTKVLSGGQMPSARNKRGMANLDGEEPQETEDRETVVHGIAVRDVEYKLID